jgi:hypothetical protein
MAQIWSFNFAKTGLEFFNQGKSRLTCINNNTGECAKKRTYVIHSGVQPLLFVIERVELHIS